MPVLRIQTSLVIPEPSHLSSSCHHLISHLISSPAHIAAPHSQSASVYCRRRTMISHSVPHLLEVEWLFSSTCPCLSITALLTCLLESQRITYFLTFSFSAVEDASYCWFKIPPFFTAIYHVQGCGGLDLIPAHAEWETGPVSLPAPYIMFPCSMSFILCFLFYFEILSCCFSMLFQ